MRPPSLPAGAERAEDIGEARPLARPWQPAGWLGYFRKLWCGEFPLSRVFWFDMLLVGTVVNAVMLVGTVLLFAADVPAAYGIIAFLLHVPYSILLFVAVLRSAARETGLWAASAQAVALVWLVIAIVL